MTEAFVPEYPNDTADLRAQRIMQMRTVWLPICAAIREWKERERAEPGGAQPVAGREELAGHDDVAGPLQQGAE